MLKKKETEIADELLTRFLAVRTAPELCRILQTSYRNVQHHILNPVYREFSIPKKRGKARAIQAPAPDLMELQQRINLLLQMRYENVAPEVSTGFRKNLSTGRKPCSIVENARIHVGKKMLLNLDIKEFFGSIKIEKVYLLFRSDLFQFPENLAKSLAYLCCYRGILPTGAPTSPVLSNFIMLKADHRLDLLAREHRCYFSRYADDLTFSGDDSIPDYFPTLVEEVLRKDGFELHPEKIRWRGKDKKQKVTGIKVNVKPNIERDYYRRIRAMMHSIRTRGLFEAAALHFGKSFVSPEEISFFIHRLTGMIAFTGDVRGRQDPLYLKLLNESGAYWGRPSQNQDDNEEEKVTETGISFFKH